MENRKRTTRKTSTKETIPNKLHQLAAQRRLARRRAGVGGQSLLDLFFIFCFICFLFSFCLWLSIWLLASFKKCSSSFFEKLFLSQKSGKQSYKAYFISTKNKNYKPCPWPTRRSWDQSHVVEEIELRIKLWKNESSKKSIFTKSTLLMKHPFGRSKKARSVLSV